MPLEEADPLCYKKNSNLNSFCEKHLVAKSKIYNHYQLTTHFKMFGEVSVAQLIHFYKNKLKFESF